MRSDEKIQKDVMKELHWDPRVSHEHLKVTVANGIVSLSGNVPSYDDKFAAEKAAQRVAGVKAVVEKVEVKLPGLYKRDDLDIARAILEQFRWNIRVPEDKVTASVEDGWVTLTGEVEWDFQRTAAEEVVRSLIGVKSVANNIRVKKSQVDTARVKEKIDQVLR